MIFKKPEPELLLTEATKTVHVSHWGFIGVDEYFQLENIGAKLRGEFNRLDYGRSGNAKNCLK